MKILVSGSSGLLGSEIMLEAEKKSIQSIGFSRYPSNKNSFEADLLNENDFAKIAKLNFDCIIHTAAWRDPDQCEKDKETCKKINVIATERLAKIAKAKKALFFHISTDYVFSGENPPYDENTPPSPVNFYGETKAQAEEIVRKTDNFIILRIPLLYGLAAGLENSALLKNSLDALASKKEWLMEDSIVRYPTFTGDVAKAIFFLIKKKSQGIFHFSGQDKTSRYRITIDIAKILSVPSDNIVRMEQPPPSETKRPKDSHLSMNKILAAGFPLPIPFKDRIADFKNILLEYYNKRINA